MSNIVQHDDLIAFHVGSYLEEILTDLGLTHKSFAKLIDISEKEVDELIAGKADLTNEEAIKLAQATGISKQSWLNIQDSYHKNIDLIKHSRNIGENKDE